MTNLKRGGKAVMQGGIAMFRQLMFAATAAAVFMATAAVFIFKMWNYAKTDFQ